MAGTGQLYYTETYRPTVHDGKAAYVLSGGVDHSKRQSDDYEKLEKGYATVTVVHADLTDRHASDFWKGLL